MNDERDDKPATPEAHEHHSVVETIREELHEVAEHVPKPVRWTVGKLVRIAVLGLLALVVVVVVSAIAYFMNRTELVARELTLLANHALARNTDLVLEMRDIKGNPLTGFRVIEPRLRYRDGGGVLLEAREMRVRYGLWSLLRGGDGPVAVTVAKPLVRFDLGPGDGWRVPKVTSSGARPRGRPRPLRFTFEMQDATVSGPKPLGRVAGLQLGARGSTGTATRVELTKLRWA